MADGFAENLGRLRDSCVEEIEEEISNAGIAESDAREALRDLWIEFAETAIQRQAGGFNSFHEAPLLLTFLRELARKGWQFLDDLPPSCWQTPEAGLRELRQITPKAARPSRRLQPREQHSRKSTDAVSVMSQILARKAQESDMMPHPLAHGATQRVGRLRGYGDAIVAPLAQAFVEAYMSK